ncbi:MAG: amidohydrolase [Rhodothermales bacterium]|nr:amidohydrolase [Rhodothermales bacterium]MBO6781063.1 amidohydrolase [Rhodothermales bacterium]
MRACILAAAVLMSACSQPADTLYTNAVIWTGTGAEASALAVTGDRISWVGDADGAPAAGEIVDLNGAFVIPGFIDNHVHLLMGGMQLASVDLRDADSPEEFARRIGEFAAGLEPGRWILGGSWDHERWGGKLPGADWIDAATPNNPVFVQRLDAHMAVANSLALELAGLTAETPDVEGGEIVRLANGSPAGVLKDEAMNLVFSVIPDPSPQEFREALDRAQAHAFSLGVTQVHDVGTYGGFQDLEVYRAAHAESALSLRIYSIVAISGWERIARLVEKEGTGDSVLRWGGVKGFVDGSLGSTTAWFYDPYLDTPQTTGLTVTPLGELATDIAGADSAGLQLAIHAIGDRANDWLLDVFAGLPFRDRLPPRIEHAQHLSDAAIARFAELGVVPSMQPYHAVDDGRWAENRIGRERAERTYAFRSLLDAGAPLTFGSDWTVAPLNPLLGIHAAVTRATIDGANPDGWIPSQKIAVEDALRAYTVANAEAGGQADQLGTLQEGKLADFVVLGEDIRSIPAELIKDVGVLRTVIGGVEVFSLPEEAHAL